MLRGISPSNVARKNFEIGTFSMGDEIFMKKLGTIGVILRKSK
jgi:hypothetical protein